MTPQTFRFYWNSIAALTLLLTAGLHAAEPRSKSDQVVPLLKKYCFECHSGDSKEGNLSLDQAVTANPGPTGHQLWWKVLKNLRSGVMPPVGHDRPGSQEQEAIADWIKFDRIGIDPADPDPGRNTARRLNRREYDNTVDDLMGIRFDAAIVFPPDDSGYGFDNVGDALGFSPLLMEKYLRAAQSIVDQSVPKETWVIPQQEFSGRDFQDEGEKVNGGRMSGKKPATVGKSFNVDEKGIFDVHVAAKLHGSFDFDPARYTVIFKVDGQDRSKHEYGWDENKLIRSQFAEDWQIGKHEMSFELVPVDNKEEGDGGLVGVDRGSTDVWFEVHSIRIEGPRGTSTRVHPRNYSSFFPLDQPPVIDSDRREYAAQILKRFATRAFRSPADPATVERLVKLAEAVYGQPGRSFESGIAHAFVAVLSSPRFLFRLESSGTPATSEKQFSQIDELALASRLSYFLWSTMPDEELFQLAESHQLRQQLPQQVQRMLRDRRASEFVRNFVGQWLRTRDVTQVTVDPIAVLGHQEEYEKLREQFRNRRRQPLSRELSPEDEQIRKRFGEFRAISDRFNDEMKRAMQRETEMCVEHVVQEDRSLLELLDCDYTFLNEKLASLYEIPGVKGPEFRKVKLPEGSPRGGVLTQASMLLVTSNPTRTSPVKRGLFVLDNILGTPAPPAPPGVPDLEESAKKFAGREVPLRELLAAHRDSRLCSSCHSRMDPLGLALENFNALGMWRDLEKNQKIDASGKLITGESFQDVRDLKKLLRERHAADFYRCLTEKMLTYALGRGLEATDEHSVDLIVKKLSEQEGRFSVLILGVIESAPFQKQRNPAVAAAPTDRTSTLPSQGTNRD